MAIKQLLMRFLHRECIASFDPLDIFFVQINVPKVSLPSLACQMVKFTLCLVLNVIL